MASSKLTTVRALLDKADSTEFEHEASALRAKAEELMRKYRIEQEDLLANRELSVETVEPQYFDIRVCSRGQYAGHYGYIFGDVARHTGIRHRLTWSRDKDGLWLWARGVGFEIDVEYAEALFTSARLAFQTKLEPEINPRAERPGERV